MLAVGVGVRKAEQDLNLGGKLDRLSTFAWIDSIMTRCKSLAGGANKWHQGMRSILN